jgi:guanylate kinase
MNPGIILYGPPASGKDTITTALHEVDPRCAPFPRLKVGPGKTHTYRMTTRTELNRLHVCGAIAWQNQRYGAIYAVDTPELTTRLTQGIVILHLGQAPAIDAVRRATPHTRWTVVELWCDRDTATQRLTRRDPTDVTERLRHWDATEHLTRPDLTIDTAHTTPGAAAGLILAALTQHDG